MKIVLPSYGKYGDNRPEWITIFLRIMKYSSLILIVICCTCIMLVAATTKGQSIAQIKVNLNIRNQTLDKVFETIEKSSQFKFTYDPAKVRSYGPVSIVESDITVEEALKSVLPSDISFEEKNAYIIITDKKKVQLKAQTYAQESVTGTVIDSVDGGPLAGVSISVVGSSIATQTDVNGKFKIAADIGATLVFKYIGYRDKIIKLDGRSIVNVAMSFASEQLQDVVVVAYGQQKKTSVTGAISSIQTKEIKQSPAANLAVTLAGRLPGLTAIQTGGEPGKDITLLYLRGRGTINGQSPVILVDGVERELTYIDPNEVESVSILKDASSTAVFGVRGANGVILITTKRGTGDHPAITFSSEYGLQDFTRTPSVVNSYDWALLRNQSYENSGLAPFYSEETLAAYRDQTDPLRFPNNNWNNMILEPYVGQQRYNLNLSGGNSGLKYFVNAGYLDQGGQYKVDQEDYDPSSFLKRYNFRSNIDVSLNKKKTLRAFLNAAGYLEKVNSPNFSTNLILASLWNTPSIQPGPTTPEGEVVASSGDGNPAYGAINRTGYIQETRSNVTASFGMEHDLDYLIKGLSAKFMMSFDSRTLYNLTASRNYQRWQQIIDPNLQGADGRDSVYYIRVDANSDNTPLATSSGSSFESYSNFQFFLNYNRVFNQKHAVTGLLLAQQDKRIRFNDRLPYNLRGISGRVTYAYDNRYLAEFNAGYNGSEQFAKGQRYGFFPSVSGGWIVSNEKFLKSNSIINLLKFRGSYGLVGNDRLGGRRFLYLDDTRLDGGGYSTNLGKGQVVNENTLGNPDIQWEKAQKTNFGLELGLLNQLTVTADIFHEKRDNILINRGTVPALIGIGAGALPPVNIGSVTNKGYELQLDYNKQFNKDFSFLTKLNFNYAKNKVDFIDEPLLGEDYAYRFRQTGFSIGQDFGYLVDGYWNSQDEIANSGLTFSGVQPGPGDLKFRDLNGDKMIDPRDFAPIGNTPVPQYTYGAAFSFTYKFIDLSVLFQGVSSVSNYYGGVGVVPNFNNVTNYHERHLESWTSERYANNLPISYPAIRLSTSASENDANRNEFFLESTSYLRLKNVELGFSLPANWAGKIGGKSIRIYANGLNLITWSKMSYNDFDPEVAGVLSYPVYKIYNFGLNVTF